MPTIRVDDQVYDELKKLAEPFEDSPNDVIRRLLTGKAFVLEQFKKCLVDPRRRIDLHDLVTSQTEALKGQLSDLQFPTSGVPFVSERIIETLHRYESVTETLRQILITGCYWGAPEQAHYWLGCIRSIASPATNALGNEQWFMLRLYPALLLLYCGGIASLAREEPDYSILQVLYSKVDTRLGLGAKPLVECMNTTWILEDRFARELPGLARPQIVPVSQYLHAVLRQSFQNLLFEDSTYDECFNRFEYLVGLVHKDVVTYQPLSLNGRFNYWDKSVIERVRREANTQKEKWPPFQHFLFGGSLKRFNQLTVAYSQPCSVDSIPAGQ